MEINYGEILLGVNEKYADEILVETSVDTAERGGAAKVLSLEAEAKAGAVELLEGEAEVSGKVNYRLLYLDRQGRLCGLDYFKDFKSRVKGDAVTPTGRSTVSFSVPDAEARITGDEITLSAVVDVLVTYNGEVQKPSVVSAEGAETLTAEVVTERVERKERTITVDKVADVGLGIKKIVLFRADAMPVSVSEGKDGLTVSGEVKGTVLYMNDADEVVELTVSLPFSENADGETTDFAVNVKSARVVLTDDEEGNVIEVEATLLLTETICRELTQNALAAVCDAKVTTEERTETVCATRFVARKCYEEMLGGTLAAEEGEMVVSFVRPTCYAIAGVTVGEGEVKVEGVSAFRVVALRDGEYVSIPAELPFVYILPFAEAQEGMTADVNLYVTDAVASVRGKDLSISAKVRQEVRLFEKRQCRYLSDVKEGAPISETTAGISVYFAEKGEDLWSIAKSVGVLPSVLLKANPFLDEPLSENKKVLIFRQK